MAEAKDKKAAPKAAKEAKQAAKETKPKAKAEAKAKATPAAGAAAPTGPTCSVETCKQPVRAKTYCRKHYIGWRREALGKHHRYKICMKEACRKPRVHAGFCAEHSAKAKPAEAPVAAAPPAA